MKIIFSNYDDRKNPYYRGGGALSIHEIAKRLAKNNDVTVLTGKYPGSRNRITDNVKYVRIGFASTGPKFSQIIFQFLLPWQVITKSFDIWIENFTPPFSTAFLPLFTKKPVIGLTQLLNAKEFGKKYHLPFFDLIERAGISVYKYFIALTEFQKKRILKINPNADVEVISNGVKIHKNINKENKNFRYMLFVGRIDIYHKGLDLLLSAYSRIKEKTELKLVIAGEGLKENIDYLNELIASYNLKKDIRLMGFVEGDKKNNLYKNAEFIIVPSRFEGFGMVILESFSFKKPVIIFKIDDLSWVPDSVSLKVTPFSIDRLSQAIVRFSEDPEFLRSKANKVSKFIKKFDWKIIALKYTDYLNSVAKTNNVEDSH